MAHDPALEAEILANRDDPEAYLVYADWLASRGDPRGELIALQHRADRIEPDNGELRMYRDEHLRRHPELVPTLDNRKVGYGWRWGFIERAALGDPSVAELQALLDHPSCRLLRDLEIMTTHDGAAALVGALLDVVRPTLESLTFESDGEQPDAPEYALHTGAWSRLPRLLHLTVSAHALSRSFEHPTLESLRILLGGEPFEGDPPWDLPALTALSFTELTDLDALCSANLPSLRHLDLRFHDVLEILANDRSFRLLSRLETLRASLWLETDPVEQLCRQATRLGRLRELTLDLHDHLGEDVEQILKAPEQFPRRDQETCARLGQLRARLQECLPNLRREG